MRNIIVYTSKKSSSLADVLAGLDDVNVRIEDAETLHCLLLRMFLILKTF